MMNDTTLENIPKKLLQFLFIILLLLVGFFASYISQLLPKGSVWNDHLADGLLLIRGIAPELPTYPMWGYSLLAGLFKENIIFFQGIIMFVIFSCWYKSILDFTTPANYSYKQTKIINNPVFVAIVLIPFIFLSLSFYSNSITYLFVFYSVWLLYTTVESKKENSMKYYAFSGLLIGLGFNFRAEVLILGILLFLALCAFGIIENHKKHYFKMAVIYLVPMILATIPWGTYTNLTVGQTLPSSTNGGAVMYLGLGTLPNNPWNIVDSDEYVGKIAHKNKLGSAWSVDANKYFKQQYFTAIKEHPNSFLKRVFLGWRSMLTQGVYLPNIRMLASQGNNKDEILFDYLNEKLKQSLGLNVNEKDMEKYNAMGLSNKNLLLKHYAIVLSEYILRSMYLSILILLLVTCTFLSLKTKFNSFISLIFLSHLFFVSLIAGFIQTLPRHTTVLLPIFLSTIIILTNQIIKKNRKDS